MLGASPPREIGTSLVIRAFEKSRAES